MKYDIDVMIKQTVNMQNVSVGNPYGTECYDFGDVVLLKYVAPLKYGGARKTAEDVAAMANKKNKQGVRTPKHLGIKREVVNDVESCWVVQEKAAGVSFVKYAHLKNPTEQLEKQRIIANAPQEHFDKLVKDLMSLLYAGLENNPKNLFYDENKENGGFIFIDLLEASNKEFSGSAVDFINLVGQLKYLFSNVRVTEYNPSATKSQIEESEKLYAMILKKVLIGMEKNVSNFKEYKRLLLRTFDKDILKNLESLGYNVGDLTLNEEDKECCNKFIDEYIDDQILKLNNNEIMGHALDSFRIEYIRPQFEYDNSIKIRSEDFPDLESYEYARYKDISIKLLKKFNTKVVEFVETHEKCGENLLRIYNHLRAVENKTL